MKFLRVLALILGLTVFANAQRDILNGTVYDALGSVIPEVKITATNQKGEKFETFTKEDGSYELTLSYIKVDESPFVLQTNKYEIVFDRTNWGFEKLIIKNYLFVGRMRFDVALDANNPEPCGYTGADCLESPIVENTKKKVQNKILQKPLEKLPKEKNKTNKRKNKNNK